MDYRDRNKIEWDRVKDIWDSGNVEEIQRTLRELSNVFHRTVLDEATKLTSGPRQEDYGHPIHDHTRTARMWTAILGTEITAEQVCLCMVALKLSRQCNKSKRDNLVDGCGYLRNIEMIQEETGKMNENERTEEVP